MINLSVRLCLVAVVIEVLADNKLLNVSVTGQGIHRSVTQYVVMCVCEGVLHLKSESPCAKKN